MSELIASDQRSFHLSVDGAVYSLSACKKAAYALMSYISVSIAQLDSHKIQFDVKLNSDCDIETEELKRLLLDELLDYSLREEIGEQTQAVRDLILSNAFSNTKLIG